MHLHKIYFEQIAKVKRNPQIILPELVEMKEPSIANY